MKAFLKYLIYTFIFLALLSIALFCLKYLCIFLFNCFLTYVDYIDYFIDSIYVSRGIAVITVFMSFIILLALFATHYEYEDAHKS